MIRKLIFAGLLVSLLMPANMMAVRENIRIMTFNIPKGNIPAEGVNTWENRCIGIQQYIKEVQPDVWGLQEAKRETMMNMLSGLPDYSCMGKARDDGYESGEYNPIFYRTDRLYVEKYGTYWLSLTPSVPSKNWDSNCMRLATWGIFRDKRTGARFFYTNTHLDHISDEARQHQMCVIKEQMEKIVAENGNMPMMITGDFNVKSTAQAYLNAIQYKIPMHDAWVDAMSREGNEVTFASDPSLSSSKSKIDFIIISKDVSCEKAYIVSSAKSNGQLLSDHNSHFADIYWQTTPEEDYYALVQASKLALDSVQAYKCGTEKLIRNANDASADCQITHDGAETKQGQYVRYLVDGSTSTFFHSLYSAMPPNNPHYLQIDLQREDVQRFVFNYTRRDDPDYGVVDRWQDVLITASNDGKTWDYITELNNFGWDELRACPSPVINMFKPYRHVRFSILHTPAMKLRNAYPQFTCSEFQMYNAVCDSTNSQYVYNNQVRVAADALAEKLDVFETLFSVGNASSEQAQELQQALQNLRSVTVDKSQVINRLAELENLMKKYTVGTKLGQVSNVVHDSISTLMAQVKLGTEGHLYRNEVDSLVNILDGMKATYLQARQSFPINVWCYIQNAQKTNKGAYDKLFGRSLYASGCNSSDVVQNGYIKNPGRIMQCTQNPFAMWKIQVVDAEKQTYTLQNRATGFYLGKPNNDKTAFLMSVEPVPFHMEICGVEDVRLYPAGLSNDWYLTAVSTDEVIASNDETIPEAAWTMKTVDDAAIGTIKIPFFNHRIGIKTLPYAVEIPLEQAEMVHTYRLKAMPQSDVFELQAQNVFAAGEPFVYISGNLETLNPTATDEVYLEVTPPDTLTNTALSKNGMYGLLDIQKVPKMVYYFLEGKLQSGVHKNIDGQTGYILSKEVQTLEGATDVTVSKTQGVTGIETISSPLDLNSKASVYHLDGTKVKSRSGKTNSWSDLPAGIYLQNGKKYLVIGH